MAEFFCQGDLEMHLHGKVSEHCVRDEKGARSAQKRFIKACVLPLYDKLGQVVPELEALTKNAVLQMESNFDHWERLGY
eukprot:CAMPEP_0173110640 /NCGR_PEP_ID=MMETSP1102-20130122/44507_1 /TAXON_ID=49646 /ORGANISM="Geminigera sp., Strain Caron Lab Isolate" /LENGTH=78 /DNA_ID=CAMNT_0014010487 /DNA_START=18 /DNA_END=254 /DNA_ORIENTATION=-